MIKRVMRVINEVLSIFDTIHKMESNIENIQTAIGRVEGRQTENLELGQYEWGDRIRNVTLFSLQDWYFAA